MNLFRRSAEQRRQRALRTAAPGPLRDYLAVAAPGPETPLDDLALLAVDIETTGLDPRRDRVLSIGWLPVDGGRVRLGGAGRVVVRDAGGAAGVGQSATVHGLTDDRLAGGVPLEDAVARLLVALDRAGAARPLRSDRDRVPRGGLRTRLGRCHAVRRRRHPRPRAACVTGGWGSRAGAGGAAAVDGPGAARACRSTGPTRRSPTRWPVPSSTSPSARSCEARTPETTLTLRHVVA